MCHPPCPVASHWLAGCLRKWAAILSSCLALGYCPANSAEGRSILEVDPQTGAATLRLPLGPGVGRPGLNYVPALIGRFGPRWDVPAFPEDQDPGGQPSARAKGDGFELSPGTLDLWLFPDKGGTIIPVARWTYPDGAGGSTRGEWAVGVTPQSFWSAFGYVFGPGPKAPTMPAWPSHAVYAGLGGDVLLEPPEAPAGFPESKAEVVQEQAFLPSRLLAVRGELAYEYQAVAGRARQPGDPCPAHYRLCSIRATTGEMVHFTYGTNGVDFEATWEAAKLRVTLSGGAAAPVSVPDAVPAEPSPGRHTSSEPVDIHLQVSYEGMETVSGHAISARVHPGTEGPSLGEHAGGSVPVPVAPPTFRRAMQVTRVDGLPSGRSVKFTYGPATRQGHLGVVKPSSLAPTVLREIILPERTLRLDWEGMLKRGDDRGTAQSAWIYGVAGVRDQTQTGSEPGRLAPTYRRVAIGNEEPAEAVPHFTDLDRPDPGRQPGDASELWVAAGPHVDPVSSEGRRQEKSWVRQSRHYAFTRNPGTGVSCETWVRDRWELGAGTATEARDPESRLGYAVGADVPTFTFDPQAGGLVPVSGQFTRWLNWKPGAAERGEAPDMHGGQPSSFSSRFRLLGGMARRSGEPAWITAQREQTRRFQGQQQKFWERQRESQREAQRQRERTVHQIAEKTRRDADDRFAAQRAFLTQQQQKKRLNQQRAAKQVRSIFEQRKIEQKQNLVGKKEKQADQAEQKADKAKKLADAASRRADVATKKAREGTAKIEVPVPIPSPSRAPAASRASGHGPAAPAPAPRPPAPGPAPVIKPMVAGRSVGPAHERSLPKPAPTPAPKSAVPASKPVPPAPKPVKSVPSLSPASKPPAPNPSSKAPLLKSAPRALASAGPTGPGTKTGR